MQSNDARANPVQENQPLQKPQMHAPRKFIAAQKSRADHNDPHRETVTAKHRTNTRLAFGAVTAVGVGTTLLLAGPLAPGSWLALSATALAMMIAASLGSGAWKKHQASPVIKETVETPVVREEMAEPALPLSIEWFPVVQAEQIQQEGEPAIAMKLSLGARHDIGARMLALLESPSKKMH